jgi:hypothetical protein
MVIQDWMKSISWKKQTVVLMSIRGPDTAGSEELKPLFRWIRSVAFKNAGPLPLKDFMKDTDFPIVQTVSHTIDRLTGHTIHHLNMALMVIAFEHPDKIISSMAEAAYHDICHCIAVSPMSRLTYSKRFVDKPVALTGVK